MLDRAFDSYQQQDWPNARKQYQHLLESNPYNSSFWFRYGKACLQENLVKEALTATEKALELGHFNAPTWYQLAQCHAKVGQPTEALQWLERAALQDDHWITRMQSDDHLASLRTHSGFQALLKPPASEIEDRISGWRADLAYLAQRLEQRHYNLYHSMDATEWKRAIQDLHERIPQMTDLEIIGALMQLVAKVGDGHTVVYPPFQGKYAFSALPVEFYFFGNDLYIRAAEPAHAAIVGAKVVAVGNMPIQELIDQTSSYLSRDNPQQVRWILPIAMVFSDIYQIIGASSTAQQVPFSLEMADGKRQEVSLAAGPLTRDPMARFAPDHWVDMRSETQALWTKNPNNNYWYQYLPEHDLMYCQVNQIRDQEGESLAAFSKRLSEQLVTSGATALVIDLRLNNGGNSFLNRAFVHELIKNEAINKHGKLFTIIGRRTFSAAMNLVSDLETETETLFVGEPTASRPNFHGEENPFTLPYSGLTGSISSRYWQGASTSDDRRIWVAPHLIGELRAVQYRSGIDPALEAVLAYLKLSR